MDIQRKRRIIKIRYKRKAFDLFIALVTSFFGGLISAMLMAMIFGQTVQEIYQKFSQQLFIWMIFGLIVFLIIFFILWLFLIFIPMNLDLKGLQKMEESKHKNINNKKNEYKNVNNEIDDVKSEINRFLSLSAVGLTLVIAISTKNIWIGIFILILITSVLIKTFNRNMEKLKQLLKEKDKIESKGKKERFVK